MGKKDNIPVNELLVKYLAGEATPEEAMVIDNWLQETPENQLELVHLQQIWQQSGDSAVYSRPDVAAEWRRFENNKQPVKPPFVVRYAARWIPAAAILLLLAGITVIFFTRNITSGERALHVAAAESSILHDTLPDNSTAVLMPGSRLQYPDRFPAAGRAVELDGEAYFNVTPDANHSFVIRMDEVGIRVIGTAFNLKNGRDSVVVDVTSGAVMFFSAHDSVVVKGGQHGIYNRVSKKFLVSGMDSAVNDDRHHTGNLVFKGIPMREAVVMIESTYKVKIVFENEKLADCVISTSFNNMPLEYVLDVITTSLSIRYEVNGATVLLRGDECK